MPSKTILEQKQAVVSDLAEKLGRAASGVLVTSQGITVADDTALRARLRQAGCVYSVIKNTLIGRACDQAGFGALNEHLNGMNALALSYDDPVAPAKILKEYADKLKDFDIRGGILEGSVVDKATVEELAGIPAKEILLARLLGSLQGPLSGLCRALQAIIDKNGEAAPAAEEAAALAEA